MKPKFTDLPVSLSLTTLVFLLRRGAVISSHYALR